MLWRCLRAAGGLAAAALLWIGLLNGAALAAPKFPVLTGRVVDDAQMLSPATEQALDAKLQGLEQQTGRINLKPKPAGAYPAYRIGAGIGRHSQPDGMVVSLEKLFLGK
ncbi:MAG: TPM domain-containing protein, partial [Alphaproteobacteria bacterium]